MYLILRSFIDISFKVTTTNLPLKRGVFLFFFFGRGEESTFLPFESPERGEGFDGRKVKRLCWAKTHTCIPSLKLTFSPLKIHGWKMTFPFGDAYFQGRTVSFWEGILEPLAVQL